MSLPRSIFFKLFAVFGLTFCILTAGLGFVLFGPADSRVAFFQENLRHYALGLAAEIGAPPDLVKAEALHQDLGLEIAVVGPRGPWSTNPEIVQRVLAPEQGRPTSPGILIWGNGVIQVRQGDWTYGFSPTRTLRQRSWVAIVLALTFLAGVLALSWAAVSRLLRPLKEMRQVFGAFGDQGWADRVKVRGKGELADLGLALNVMADRVEGYVGSMHRLLAGVSHELRSPLTRMKVALEFIDNAGIRASLNEEIGYLDRVTGLLLERERLRSRPEALVRGPVALVPWIDSLVAPYRATGMAVTVAGPDLQAEFDADRMAMALRNLLENAGRHAPGSPVRVSWTKEADNFILVCEDQGPGMPPEALSHLGEPFYLVDRSRTGNRQRGGFGLGLSLVFSIVEAHGGLVRVENASPHGLRVSLDLPDETIV